ncbi:MAG TPA: hypothetical protein VFS17_05805 [Methylophilaceae bacterium]|nr:hypothetical protein [Methylophilaceae bacterium]
MRSGNSPAARLKHIGRTLSTWHKARLANGENDQAELSLADIHGLRQLIGNEIGQLRLNNPEIVADQILFLLIGAIRLQLQDNAKQPWELVNHSIAGFLRPPRAYNPLWIGLSAISIAMVFAISLVRLQPAHHPAPASLFEQNASGTAAINEAGMNSVNNLVAIYHRMQRGECQLPQAAMLQPEEREAFISFINNGHVELDSAGNLKKSLQYVNCLYPQKLMGSL